MRVQGLASVTEVLEKMRNIECGLSEGCRLNQPGVARHGGIGRAGRAPNNFDSGSSITHKCVSLWIVIFLPVRTAREYVIENTCSSFSLLHKIYQFVCIYKLVAQFLQKVRFLGSLWTGYHESVSCGTVK